MLQDLILKQKTQEGRIEIRVVENKEVIFSQRSLLRNQQYSINLDVFHPKPIAFRSVPSRPLAWAVIFGGLGLLFLASALFSSVSQDIFLLYTFAVIFGLVAASCLFSLYKNYRDVYIFKSRHNGENTLIIARGKPSEGEVNAFVDELERRIDSIKYDGNLSLEAKAEVYKKHLEFLFQEGVISQEVFSQCLASVEEKAKKAPVIKLV
jgi:hypothetical protein